jgi:ABC-type glycerol-3-phosphate transport system substrate-binding protein
MKQRKVSRREFLKVAALASAGAALAACQPTEAPTVTTEEPADTAPEPEERELIVWFFAEVAHEESEDDGLWQNWMHHHYKEFEPRYPGLTIKTEARGWDADLRTGLLTAIAGGVAPDVTHGEAYVREFAKLGAFAALPDELIDKFPYGPIAGGLVDGKLYGIPAMSGAFALMVNTEVLEEAGLDPDDDPENWEDYLTKQQTVWEETGKSAAYIWGPDPQGGYGSAMRIMPWINQTGVQLGTDDGVPTFDAPASFQAYEFLKQQYEYATDAVTFQAEGEAGATKLLTDGEIAYMVAWTNNVTGVGNTDPKPPVKMIRLPVLDAGKAANTTVGNITFSPLKTGENVEDAINFCAYLTEDTAQIEMTKYGIFVPATISALTTEGVEDNGG